MSEVVFSVDAERMTVERVARAFAATYWAEPRAVEEWRGDEPVFAVENGRYWYAVEYVPAVPLETYATYQVRVVGEREDG